MKSLIRFAHLLEGETLLLLGGTGFLGSYLVPLLIDQIEKKHIQTTIIITTRNKQMSLEQIPCLRKPFVRLLNIDFFYEKNIEEDINPTYILHMANTSAFDTHSKIRQVSKFNLLQNASFFLESVIKKSSVKKLLFTSSGVVYGNREYPKEYDYPSINHFSKDSSLAVAKISSEYYLNQICEENDVLFTSARVFSIIGEKLPLRLHYAVGNFVDDAIHKRDIVVRSDGKDKRSYLNVSDVTEWIMCLLSMNEPPRILNVGSSDIISIKKLAYKVKHLINPRSQVVIQNNYIEQGNMRRNIYCPNIDLAKSLGLRETIDLDSSLQELAEYAIKCLP